MMMMERMLTNQLSSIKINVEEDPQTKETISNLEKKVVTLENKLDKIENKLDKVLDWLLKNEEKPKHKRSLSMF